jgi:hypothetical protein
MAKKRATIMKPDNLSGSTSKKSEKLETKILENLVELQKVHTNLAEKFDKLAGEISSLLKLFEGAAKTFVSGPGAKEFVKDQEFLDKIDKLLEQNKTIAKGLTLMEDRIRERVSVPQPAQQPLGVNNEEAGEYTPSMAGRQIPKF